MDFPGHIFRGYDLRGIADTELNDDMVERIARAFATMLYQRRISEVVVGRDNRLSGERIVNKLIQTLTESGFDVIDIGMTLSQIVYFAQYHFKTKGAVMVSASHNPKEYNGMKFGIGYSDTLVTEELIEMRELAKNNQFKKYDRVGSCRKEDVFDVYKADILKRFVNLPFNYKIVVDTGNNTSGMFLPVILRDAGCEVIEQNTTLDGNFPLGTPDPTEREFLERLAKRVVEEKADMGFAYDPDGDRIGVVDGQGNPIWNDVLVALFASDILDSMPGSTIIYNTLCSRMVKEVINTKGGKPLMWLTGHSFIKAKVKETRSPFGGELSGHFFFMDNFYGHDDSANASLRLLSYLKRHNLSMKGAVDELPKYVSSPEIKLGLADDIKFSFITNVIAPDLKQAFPDAEVDILEGVRIEFDNSMTMIRASQNGPYITIKFESKTNEGYERLKVEIERILRSHSEIDFSTGVNIEAFE